MIKVIITQDETSTSQRRLLAFKIVGDWGLVKNVTYFAFCDVEVSLCYSPLRMNLLPFDKSNDDYKL